MLSIRYGLEKLPQRLPQLFISHIHNTHLYRHAFLLWAWPQPLDLQELCALFTIGPRRILVDKVTHILVRPVFIL